MNDKAPIDEADMTVSAEAGSTHSGQPADEPAARPFSEYEFLRNDMSFGVAFTAAGSAYLLALPPEELRGPDDADPAFFWPSLGDENWASEDDFIRRVHAVLTAFARQYRDAPPEALFRHAGEQRLHDAGRESWPDLPLPSRLAYAVFRRTLIETDALLDAERAAFAAAQPRPAPRVAIDAEDYTMGRHDQDSEIDAQMARR